MTREEWNAMTPDEQWLWVTLSEEDIAGMRGVLSEIPECTHHGFCLPHFRNWIRDQRGKLRTDPFAEYMALEMDKAMRLLFEKDAKEAE